MFQRHKYIKRKKGRTFVVGDVHGNLGALFRLLHKIEFNPESDLLISIGDIIDRGEHNLACLTYMMDNPAIEICAGNHEEMFVEGFTGKEGNRYGMRAVWQANGGEWGDNVGDELLTLISNKLLQQAFYAITVQLKCGTKIGLTHGDMPFEEWPINIIDTLKQTDFSQWLWGRKRAKEKSSNDHVITGVDYTIHGHTPFEKPKMFHNSIFIDTGCGKAVRENALTAIHLERFAETKILEESIIQSV